MNLTFFKQHLFTMVIILAVLLMTTSFFNIAAWAQSTKSATPSAKLIEQLRLRLEVARKEKQLKVVSGIVKGILGSNISVATITATRTIKIQPETDFTITGQKSNIANLQVEDFVVAVGNFDQTGTLVAKIFQVSPDEKPASTSFGIVGIVSQINEDFLMIVKNAEQIKINSTSQTKITTIDGSETETASIKIGSKVGAVGTGAEDVLKASEIVILGGDFSDQIITPATGAAWQNLF